MGILSDGKFKEYLKQFSVIQEHILKSWRDGPDPRYLCDYCETHFDQSELAQVSGSIETVNCPYCGRSGGFLPCISLYCKSEEHDFWT